MPNSPTNSTKKQTNKKKFNVKQLVQGVRIRAGVVFALLIGVALMAFRSLVRPSGTLLLFLIFSLIVSVSTIQDRTVQLWVYSATERPEHLSDLLKQYQRMGDKENLHRVFWSEFLRRPSNEFFDQLYPITLERELAVEMFKQSETLFTTYPTSIEVVASYTRLSYQLGNSNAMNAGLQQWKYLDPNDARLETVFRD